MVITASGGKGGGGTNLTSLGRELLLRYAALEHRINAAVLPELDALQSLAGESEIAD